MDFSNFCVKKSVEKNPKVGGWENLIWIDVQAPVNGLDVTSGVTTVEISRSIFRFEPFEHTPSTNENTFANLVR